LPDADNTKQEGRSCDDLFHLTEKEEFLIDSRLALAINSLVRSMMSLCITRPTSGNSTAEIEAVRSRAPEVIAKVLIPSDRGSVKSNATV
jgi:hypothetical protein